MNVNIFGTVKASTKMFNATSIDFDFCHQMAPNVVKIVLHDHDILFTDKYFKCYYLRNGET